MITLAKAFGGLNNRAEPHLLGPELAQDLSNVLLDSGGIRPQLGPGASVATATGTIASVYRFGAVLLAETVAWQYAELGGRLYRAAAARAPQKSLDGTTWHNLGNPAPGAGPTAAAGAAGVPNGTYTYVVTFTSSLFGSESAPSPVGTVTVANQQVDLSALPIGVSTGATTNGSPSVTGVTNPTAWVNGARITGAGIPAGTTILSGGGTATLTLSANATATAAGVALQDPQHDGRKLYRAGGTASATQLVTTFADLTTTTYTDNAADGALGATLTTTGYGMPGALAGIFVTPTARLGGWIGPTWAVTSVSLPDSWPTANGRTLPEDIVAMLPFAGAFVVLTAAQPYIVSGSTPDTFSLERLSSQQGCIGRDTAVDMGDAVVYASNDGIVSCNGVSAEVVSKGALSDAFWAGLVPVAAARYNERYILFHTTGWVEMDPRIPGDSPWRKGALTGTQVSAAAYARAVDTLYVGVGTAMKAWEAGAALTYSYKTGDWSGKVPQNLKNVARVGIQHEGTITVTPYVDGVARGSAQTATRSTLGLSPFWVPFITLGGYGHRVAVEVGGTGRVIAIEAEVYELTERADG